MKPVVFASQAAKDYENWAARDKRTFKKIVSLISGIDRNPFSGLGKPEPLKHELATFWSRRINSQDRLIYRISKEMMKLLSSAGKALRQVKLHSRNPILDLLFIPLLHFINANHGHI